LSTLLCKPISGQDTIFLYKILFQTTKSLVRSQLADAAYSPQKRQETRLAGR